MVSAMLEVVAILALVYIVGGVLYFAGGALWIAFCPTEDGRLAKKYRKIEAERAITGR